MYLQRLALVALAGVVSAVPLGRKASPVVPARKPSPRRPDSWLPTPSRMLPQIRQTPSGSALPRETEMKDVAGRNFTVVEQSQMNDALKQYGYPMDAILSPPLATTLAKNIQARVLMTGTMVRAGRSRRRHRSPHRGQR